jgi:hypothetical protein
VAQNTQKPRLVAVDTNVLLDLAAGIEEVRDCVETIKQRIPGHLFVIPPTVTQELADIADEGQTLKAKELALKALSNLLDWGFQPLNCAPVGHGITEQIGRKLRDRELIPDLEENDSLIVAESALAGATLLLSSDAHIKDIDPTSLKLVLDECDVTTPLIASPKKIVKNFFQKT